MPAVDGKKEEDEMNELALALADVMTWVKNWDAAFLEDTSGEWQQTEANVQYALKAAGMSENQLRNLKTYAFDDTVSPRFEKASS